MCVKRAGRPDGPDAHKTLTKLSRRYLPYCVLTCFELPGFNLKNPTKYYSLINWSGRPALLMLV